MTLVTPMFVTDAAPMRDPARERERERVLDQRNRIKMQVWSDPGDAELKTELARLEDELRMLDRGGNGKDVDEHPRLHRDPKCSASTSRAARGTRGWRSCARCSRCP